MSSPSLINRLRSNGWPDFLCLAGLITSILLTLFLTTSFSDTPFNDDFSYARSAQAFAEKNLIIYNGWSTPILIPQIVLGGLLLKLTGFSYTVLHLASIFLTALTAWLFYGLARRLGSTPLLATLCTAILFLNPISLSLAPAFMTEIPSLALLLVSLHILIRGLSSPTALGSSWLISMAALVALLAGLNRQLSWITFLGLVASLWFFLPQQRRQLGLGFIICATGMAAASFWFSQQPYAVIPSLSQGLLYFTHFAPLILVLIYKLVQVASLLLLPLIPMLFSAVTFKKNLILPAVLILILAVSSAILPANRLDFGVEGVGQAFTAYGSALPQTHPSLPTQPLLPPFFIISLLLFNAASCFFFWILLKQQGQAVINRRLSASLTDLVVISLLLGNLLTFLSLLPWFSYGFIYDRYLISFLPPVLLFLGQVASQLKFSRKQGGAAFCLTALLWLTGSAYAWDRGRYVEAKIVLYNELIQEGIPAFRIDAGMEMNGDVQIQLGGYINNPYLRQPAGAFQKNLPRQGLDTSYKATYFPAIQPEYFLSTAAPSHIQAQVVKQVDFPSLLQPTPPTMFVYYRPEAR